MQKWTFLLIAAACLAQARPGSATDALAESLPARAFKVGYFNLSGEESGENPALFVATLDAVPGIDASLAGSLKPGHSWRAVPTGTDPAGWISLVRVMSGRQCDFLAFLFGQDGAVQYAGRRPSRVAIDPPRYPLTVPPGPNQIPANAIREPATDFVYRYATQQARPRPLLRIVIGGAVDEKKTSGDAVATEGPDDGFEVPAEPAEALAFAAAFEAGWRPTSGAAERTLHLSLMEELRMYNTAVARFDDGTPGFNRKSIPKEQLFSHLVGLFFQLRCAKSVGEAAPFGMPGTVLMGWAAGKAILREGDDVKAVDVASGRTLWSLVPGERAKPLYATQRDAAGALQVFRYDGGIRRLDLNDGKEQELAPQGVGGAGRFALAQDGRLAVVDAGVLSVYQDGKPVWTWDGAEQVALPAWGEALVFVAGADGAVHALHPAERREAWSAALNPAGPLRFAVQGGMLLVDDGKSLAAHEMAKGTRLWTVGTGDVLLSDPVIMDDRIFVAVKSNALRIWNAKTGAAVASRDWPTWILAARAVKTGKGWSIACVDLRNRLSVLDPATLATKLEISFPAALAPVLDSGAEVPRRWALDRVSDKPGWEEDLIGGMLSTSAPRGPAWLVADQGGTCYAVPAEPEAEQ